MVSKLIDDIHIFQELEASEMNVIRGILRSAEYEPDDVIFKEDEPGGSLHIIVKGKVRVNKMTAEGDQFNLSTRTDGDMFGIMSFLDGSKHDATTVADQQTHIVILKKSDFDNLMQSHPLIGGKVLRRLALHLAVVVRNMNAQYMDLMHLMFRKSK